MLICIIGKYNYCVQTDRPFFLILNLILSGYKFLKFQAIAIIYNTRRSFSLVQFSRHQSTNFRHL